MLPTRELVDSFDTITLYLIAFMEFETSRGVMSLKLYELPQGDFPGA